MLREAATGYRLFDERWPFLFNSYYEGEGERLARCLESVRAMADPGGPVELIYVDSASTDGSPERAAALGAQVITVQPERPSAALGRNAGWRAAQAQR